MADKISKEHRSWNMSRIRSKDTKPEKVIRSLLHRAGLRFRLHCRNLPGKPDLVFPRYKTVIFVHGCFWHRHEGCRDATTLGSRTEFWNRKFSDNIQRDKKVKAALEEMGWRVLVVWECEIKKNNTQLKYRILKELGVYSMFKPENDGDEYMKVAEE